MAPDIPKIDPDRHLNLGDAAWNFRNEVFRWLFHGNSLSDPEDLLIPFFGNFVSWFMLRPDIASLKLLPVCRPSRRDQNLSPESLQNQSNCPLTRHQGRAWSVCG